jgi:hypothetical protein
MLQYVAAGYNIAFGVAVRLLATFGELGNKVLLEVIVDKWD